MPVHDEENGQWGGAMSTPRAKFITCSGVTTFCLAATVILLSVSLHIVDEGHVGIYIKHGALMDDYSLPGVHMLIPFFTEVQKVSIRPTTDTLRPIEAITKDGITNKFAEVQVRFYY